MAYSIAEEFETLPELFLKENIVYTVNIFQHRTEDLLHFPIKKRESLNSIKYLVSFFHFQN